MRLSKALQTSIAALAWLGMVCQGAVGLSADDRDPPVQPKVHDVRLDRDGRFQGLVVDGQGTPLSSEAVILRRIGRRSEETLESQTDAQGKFAFRPMTGGMYHLETSEGLTSCRLWTFEAAPPSSAERILVINDSRIARGQHPISHLFTSDPVLMAAVVATAIAIPIIIHKTRDDPPPGS